MRSRIEDFLDMIEPRGYNAVETRRQIQHFVCSDPALEWALEPPEAPTLCERFRFWTPPVSAIAVVVGLMILALREAFVDWPASSSCDRRSLPSVVVEGNDRPSTVTAPEFSHVQKLTQREDRCPQNHLTTITDLKPGPFRFTLLKGVAHFHQRRRPIHREQRHAGRDSEYSLRPLGSGQSRQAASLSEQLRR